MDKKIVKLHRLNITLQDVATTSGRSMHEIYTDVKRGKLVKDSLSSIVEYVNQSQQELQLKTFSL